MSIYFKGNTSAGLHFLKEKHFNQQQISCLTIEKGKYQ